MALKRYKEAIPDWDRLAATTAPNTVAKANGVTGETLYYAAGAYAMAVTVAGKSEDLANHYAEQAIDLMARAPRAPKWTRNRKNTVAGGVLTAYLEFITGGGGRL